MLFCFHESLESLKGQKRLMYRYIRHSCCECWLSGGQRNNRRFFCCSMPKSTPPKKPQSNPKTARDLSKVSAGKIEKKRREAAPTPKAPPSNAQKSTVHKQPKPKSDTTQSSTDISSIEADITKQILEAKQKARQNQKGDPQCFMILISHRRNLTPTKTTKEYHKRDR